MTEAPAPRPPQEEAPQAAPDKSASLPLWKKVVKSALYFSSALVAPVSFRAGSLWPRLSLGKTAIFFGVPLLAMPMAANLFPTAEEVLSQRGYPSALVQDLAPDRNNIRVRPDNIWGKAHAFLSSPLISTLRGNNDTWEQMNSPHVLGLAQRGGAWSPDVVFVSAPRVAQSVSSDLQLSASDKWLHTFLHEVRHVSGANADLMVTLAREADSDYESARAMAARLNRPDIPAAIMTYKSGIFPATHDTALYLSARFNGTVAPAVQDMAQANKDAQAAFFELQLHENPLAFIGALDCHIHQTPRRPCQYTVAGQPLSALATQRLGFYFNAYLAESRAQAELSAPEPAPSAPQETPTPRPPRRPAS